MKYVPYIVLIATICLSAVMGYRAYTENDRTAALAVIDSFGVYSQHAFLESDRVRQPGEGTNENRREVMALLETILTAAIDDAERLLLAKKAYEHLDAIKKDIDAAERAQGPVFDALRNVEDRSDSLRSPLLQKKAAAFIALMKEREELSWQITSIHGSMNEEALAIISRILAARGALEPSHIEEINSGVTNAEERFEKVSGLYKDFDETQRSLYRTYREFVAAAL